MLFSCSKRQTSFGEFVNAVQIPNARLRKLFRCGARIVTGWVVLSVLAFISYRLHFSVAAVASVFLVAVMIESLSGDFSASAAVSLIAFAYLDYFFTDPKLSFVVADPSDFLDLIAFLLAALVITRLVSRLRLQERAAQVERRRTERLFRLAQELLTLEPKTAIDSTCLEPFCRVFEMRAVSLFDQETSELHSAGESHASLGDRTRDAYLTQKNSDDHLTRVSTRCLRIAGKTQGAIGFEDLDECNLMAGPLAAIAATVLERTQAFRSASQAVATAQSEAYRSAILDALAHEFKTPLATILAAAGGLQEAGPLKPAQMEMTETVETEAAHLGQLTSRLLRMARLDREEVRPQMEWIDIVSLAEQVVERYSKLRTGRGISLLKGCRSAETIIDPELVRLAISQLLDNACKYSDLGSTVTVTIDDQDDVIAIRVSNTGSSISLVERHRVFDRYYRGTEARNLASGSGLGLYVARKIALAHGGRLELEDPTAADGTTFRLIIPVSKSEAHHYDLSTAAN